MSGKLIGGLVLSVAVVSLIAWAQKSGTGPAYGEKGDVQLIKSIQGPALYKAYCASCHGVGTARAMGRSRLRSIQCPRI